MIHVDMRTGDHYCDQCQATLPARAGDQQRNAFQLEHGQCRGPAQRAPK